MVIFFCSKLCDPARRTMEKRRSMESVRSHWILSAVARFGAQKNDDPSTQDELNYSFVSSLDDSPCAERRAFPTLCLKSFLVWKKCTLFHLFNHQMPDKNLWLSPYIKTRQKGFAHSKPMSLRKYIFFTFLNNFMNNPWPISVKIVSVKKMSYHSDIFS